MNEYLNNLNKLPSSSELDKIKEYANKNNVPIITDQGLAMLVFLVDLIKPKSLLEIGTAIGFSSISLASYSPDLYIDTIERDEMMFQEAIKNIKLSNLEERINVIKEDALEVDLSILKEEYDLIFIDGAKAQYINFFEKYKDLLSLNGVIITDNLLFHGFVIDRKSIKSKNLKDLVRKIDRFNLWLKDNDDFETTFLSIGDGMALSKRKKK